MLLSAEDTLEKYFVKDVFGNDFAFVVEDREIWVSRSMLRRYSPVFEAMFTAEFREKDRDKVPFPNKKFADMFEFAQCLFPCPNVKSITLENAFTLMPLADEYEVEDLKTRIERFFVAHLETMSISHGTPINSFIEILIPATKYRLNDVVKKCVPKLVDYLTSDIRPFYKGELPLSVFALIFEMKLAKGEYRQTNNHLSTCCGYKLNPQGYGMRQYWTCSNCGGKQHQCSVSNNMEDQNSVNSDLFEKFMKE